MSLVHEGVEYKHLTPEEILELDERGSPDPKWKVTRYVIPETFIPAVLANTGDDEFPSFYYTIEDATVAQKMKEQRLLDEFFGND